MGQAGLPAQGSVLQALDSLRARTLEGVRAWWVVEGFPFGEVEGACRPQKAGGGSAGEWDPPQQPALRGKGGGGRGGGGGEDRGH